MTRWSGGCALVLFTLLLSSRALASAEFTQVVGLVEVQRAALGSWQLAVVGQTVDAGDVVRTGSDGRAELRSAGATVRLFEKTLLHVGGDSRGLALTEGSGVFDVLERAPGNPFRVRTPHAVVMVKGTRFTVSVDAAAASVGVSEGLVAVSRLGTSSHQVLVRPGFQANGSAAEPFALTLLERNSWEAWELGGAAPDAPGLLRARVRQARRERLQASIRGSLERSRAPVPASADASGVAAASSGGHGMLETDVGARVQQGFAAQQLGPVGSFTVTPQGMGGAVRVTGPMIDEVLGVGQIAQAAGGNTGVLSANLLGLLATQGVDPQDFAQQLSQMF